MTPKARDVALWLPYVVVAVVHVGSLAAQGTIAGPTKLLLMPLLAIPVIAAARGAERRAIVLIGAALLFSWFGDSVGAVVSDGDELPFMLLFFAAAHVAYIVLFVRILAIGPMPRWALVYVVWWVVMVAVVGLRAGALFLGVGAYGLVLQATAATASRCNRTIAIGAALFLTSDSLLALLLFLPETSPGWFDPLAMATYVIGQGLISFGALQALRPGDSSTSGRVG
ncbi:Uncharacterized membrane protein YhhN [Gordonia malaquae]|uniref:YhhN family protein n=1 Tax=Gordonia malaquae NBRC 108250 TaxID=1223542 RepID=M3UNP5_GORML|nr:lysoplasmalogenase family protein [Gordonia malaquae]GAC81765.1 hypothetical protein GM1_044_00130 [Gordonia malaquae NBRC 108250]SED47163.1 Uncharacterized membrane protein YhhN [Gordonia malaquae]